MINYCPDLNRNKLKTILEQVPNDLYTMFTMYVYSDVRKYVEQTQPDDVASYMISSMNNWIASNCKRIKQKELFDDVEDIDEETQEDDMLHKKISLVQGDKKELWDKLLKESNEDTKAILSRCNFLGTLNGYLCVELSKEDDALFNDSKIAMEIYKETERILGIGIGSILKRITRK